MEFIGHQEQDEAMSAQPPANEPQLNSAAGLHEMPAQPRADEPQHNSSAGLHGMPAQAVGYTGIEGDLHPACLLQTQHTGSDATTGGFGSVREGSGLADMVEAVPDQPLSASGQHPSAPQALQEGLSGHHVTGCAVTDMQQAPSVTYFMTQAEALHSVAQWMGDRRCVLKCDRGSLLVQHAMCAEALDPSMCHAPVQTSSHMSGAAAALLDHVQDNPDKCKGTGQLPSDTDVDVQPRQVSCSQPAAQRKRKREVETSLASKKQRLCARLRSSLRNISCGLIALWIFSCFSVS